MGVRFVLPNALADAYQQWQGLAGGFLLMHSNTQRRAQILQAFQERFGAAPSLWARAPGRVDLMGSHTDYNRGYVLTLPIDRDTWIAARPRDDDAVSLYSMNLGEQTNFHAGLNMRNRNQRWSDYVRGVAWVIQEAGLALHGFHGVIHSTVPIGSGLSSSAALECAAATVFEALGGWQLDPVKKAMLCQQAENQFVGVNCGILDQYTSCVGQAGCALLLDCRDLSSQPVRLADGVQVVICDTKSKRELAGSEYGKRRAQCEEGARLLGVKALREASLAQFNAREGELPSEVARRCRFIVEENARVPRLAEALAIGDRAAIRHLCAESYHGAMTLYEIGVPAMEVMREAMLGSPGVMGARQAGAGFGGCMVAFVERGAVPAFAAAVRENYAKATRIQADVYAVEAAPGAGCF